MAGLLQRVLEWLGAGPPTPAPGTPTGACLRLASETGAEVFALTDAPLTIGRHPRNDVVLLDRSVASRHARVVWSDGRHVVEALGGARMRVNGLPCERAPLAEGDTLEIADFRFAFASAGAPRPAPPGPSGPRLMLVTESGWETWSLGDRPLSIGRDPSRDIVLLDRTIEPEHARILREDGHAVIAAVGQARVSVNGGPITRARLADGDRIQLGDFRFEFRA